MILLDTHVLVWFWHGRSQVGHTTRQLVEREWRVGNVDVSAISFWEVAMLSEKGRIGLLAKPAAWRRNLLDHGLVEIPIDGAIAARAGALHDLHGDPADRLILATALEGHRRVTADSRLLDWPGSAAVLDARQ
jgi:PIN domain nuclease of toxin-antitoxin system